MLKRLARILIILIILVGLYRYTSIFDNTKIKPYLENINNGIANLFSKSGSGSKTTINETANTTGQGLTGASAFNDNDVIDFRTSSNSNSQTNSTGSTEMRNSGNNNQNQEVEEVEAKILDIKLSDLNQSSSKFPNGCVTPRGEDITNGAYFIAYGQQVSHDCKRERRFCTNGQLDGSYQYDTCYYSDAIIKQQQNSMLTQSELKALQIDLGLNYTDEPMIGGVVWSRNSDDPSFSGKDMELYADGESGSSLRITNNSAEKHFLGKETQGIEILANGQTAIPNHVYKSQTLQKQLQGHPKTSFITNNKTVDAKNSYARKICTTPRWSIISNGQFVYAFKNATAEGNSCEVETRFCLDGKLQWSFVNPNCKGNTPTIVDTPKPTITDDYVTVAFTETRNTLRYLPVPLELMASTPMNTKKQYTTVQTSSYTNMQEVSQPFNVVGQSYLIYHQPDEVDHGNQPPEYMFVGASSIQ